MQFMNVGKANARISQLEKQLGLPVGDKILKLKSANQRIAELEGLAQKTSSSGAAASPVYAKDLPDAPPIARTAAPVLYPSRPKMLAAVREVLHSASWATESESTAELFHACERAAWANHLKIPGMGTDEEMAACGYLRPEKTDGGSARLIRAMKQDRLNEIFGRY